MPSLIPQPDGSVLWDYDLPEFPVEPAKKTAKSVAETPKEK